jgi:hypothetical protein
MTQGINIAVGLAPRDDETRFAGAAGAPIVELEAQVSQRSDTRIAESNENFVRLHGVHQPGTCGSAYALCEAIRVICERQP